MHHQRGVGRHQVHQRRAKLLAQALSGGEHPRHVGFGNDIKQTHHQAVDRHHFNAWLHAVFSASRIRFTAATELALSPCTHKVLACNTKALPSLAVRASPREIVNACCTMVSASWCTAPGNWRETRCPLGS